MSHTKDLTKTKHGHHTPLWTWSLLKPSYTNTNSLPHAWRSLWGRNEVPTSVPNSILLHLLNLDAPQPFGEKSLINLINWTNTKGTCFYGEEPAVNSLGDPFSFPADHPKCNTYTWKFLNFKNLQTRRGLFCNMLKNKRRWHVIIMVNRAINPIYLRSIFWSLLFHFILLKNLTH